MRVAHCPPSPPAALGDDRDHVEVRPPETGCDGEAEERGGDHARVEHPVAPAPRATIDSPSAMITISPWRSTKWPGERCQPRARPTYGPRRSTASAIAPDGRGLPSRPRRQRAGTPIARPLRGLADRREQSRSPRPGNGVEDEVRDPDDRVGAGEEEASSPKAPGTANEAISIAAMAPNMTSRTIPSSGSIVFVSQA